MSDRLTLCDRPIGRHCPLLIVAEMSGNHNKSLDRALEIVDAAAAAGADALKIQTYTPDTMTMDVAEREFLITDPHSPWADTSLYKLYSDANTPWEWHEPIFARARERGLIAFSTPFDETAVDFLERLNVPCYKIASFELVDTGLLRKVAGTGKPVIMSTGMATLGEIDEAVRTLRAAGCTQAVLLKCTSAYPAPSEEMNLRTIPHLAEAFGVPVGLSDHTLGIAVPVAAVALGACLIEKHLTLRRSDGGPDATFSLEPAEFKQMVDAVRVAEAALGRVNYEMTEKEAASRVFRRSLFVVNAVKAGEPFTSNNVRSIRPGTGMAPKYLDEVIGRRAASDIVAGTPLSRDLIG